MAIRWKAALLGRAAVSLAVLAVFGVLLTGVVVGMVLGLVVTLVAPAVVPTLALLTLAPRASAVLPVPAVLACGLSWVALSGLFRYGDALERALGIDHLWWPVTPASAATTAVSLGLLYEGVVELAVVVVAAATAAPVTATLAVGAFAAAVGVWLCLKAVRREVASLREATVEGADPAPEWLDRRVTRLCATADVPSPAVFLHPSRSPVAFTVGTATTRSIVVSRGVVDALGDAELDAVLAHEVSHIANRDVTVVSAALAPVVVGQAVLAWEPETVRGRLARWVGAWLLRFGEFGAGTLSRGREFAADRAAARVTGRPAALASALETLSTADPRPDDGPIEGDLALKALNVVPRATARRHSFDTHPETAARIARLREVERAQETA